MYFKRKESTWQCKPYEIWSIVPIIYLPDACFDSEVIICRFNNQFTPKVPSTLSCLNLDKSYNYDMFI